MDLKKKIIVIISFCIILSAGSFIIINSMFDKIEEQLEKKCSIAALIGSRIMTDMMDFMVRSNLLTEKQLFDTNYKRITGTNLAKFSTEYDDVFDGNIQKIEDEFLEDNDVIYAILIDKNGYVPTHNTRFSKPETGNRKYDLMYSRTKRNFATNESIRNALNFRGQGTIKMLYYRDTGETIWNIGAPVRYKGNHWGVFLVGVSLSRVEAIKNQMVILIVTIMFVILSLTMLAILAVIPKKYLPDDSDASRT